MTFRADESAARGLESAKNYLIPREIKADEPFYKPHDFKNNPHCKS